MTLNRRTKGLLFAAWVSTIAHQRMHRIQTQLLQLLRQSRMFLEWTKLSCALAIHHSPCSLILLAWYKSSVSVVRKSFFLAQLIQHKLLSTQWEVWQQKWNQSLRYKRKQRRIYFVSESKILAKFFFQWKSHFKTLSGKRRMAKTLDLKPITYRPPPLLKQPCKERASCTLLSGMMRKLL